MVSWYGNAEISTANLLGGFVEEFTKSLQIDWIGMTQDRDLVNFNFFVSLIELKLKFILTFSLDINSDNHLILENRAANFEYQCKI